MPDTYKIARFYESDRRRTRIIKRGLTLEQAQAHCNDPETSSESARKPAGCGGDEAMIERWHEKQKHWFDGYAKETTL